MKKKIIGSIILLLILALVLSGNSFAYTWDEFVEFEGYANNNQTNTSLKSSVNWFLGHQSAVYSQLNTLGVNKDNYQYFLMFQPTSSLVKCRIMFISYSGSNNASYYIHSSNGITFSNYGTAILCDIWDTGYNPSKQNYTLSNNLSMGVCTGLLPTEPSDGNYRGYVLNNYYIAPPTFVFTPLNILYLDGVNINKFDYMQNSINLGVLDDTNDYWELQVRIKDEFGINYGTMFASTQIDYPIYTSGSLSYENYVLSASTQYLKYNQIYNLEMIVYSDRNNYETYIYKYKFLPMNAVISNGSIVSTGSGDFSNQDLAIAIGSSIDNVNNTINNFFNQEASGEVSLSDLPSVSITDPSMDFFTWLLTSIHDVLTNMNNVTLTIPLYGSQSYSVASNVFVFPNGNLRTFIQAGWWFVCGVPFLKFIRHIIHTIEGGEVPCSDEKSDLLGHIL